LLKNVFTSWLRPDILRGNISIKLACIFCYCFHNFNCMFCLGQVHHAFANDDESYHRPYSLDVERQDKTRLIYGGP